MEIKLRLDCGNWYAYDYVIVGDKDIGYEIYDAQGYDDNIDFEPIRSYDDFESALIWIINVDAIG